MFARTMTASPSRLPDAPLPDELAIICAFANRGRPNHRVGGLAAGDIKGADGLT